MKKKRLALGSREDITLVVCPVPDCEEGTILRREQTRTGYSVTFDKCRICRGSGAVSVEVAAAYREFHEGRGAS